MRRYTARDAEYQVTSYKHSGTHQQKISDSLYLAFKAICVNSYSTIHRIEELQNISEVYDPNILEKDIQALNNFYNAIIKWINDANLKKVVLFNGRMDLLGAAKLACENKNVGYFCYEGTFFGKGAYLYENTNCLSVKHWKLSCEEFIDKPLTNHQSIAALNILQSRLNRETDLEWRSYFEKSSYENESSLSSELLILLSSTNEVYESKDYKTNWVNYLEGIDEIIKVLDVTANNVIVRGHPAWATKICGIGGEPIEQLYGNWAKSRGYRYIESNVKLDTQYLIKYTENVIINYSSAFFEASYYNKKVFLTHAGSYDYAGIALNVDHPDKLKEIIPFVKQFDYPESKILRLRKLLRFTYIAAFRLPAFTEDIHPNDKLSWHYSTDSDNIGYKILEFLNNGKYPYSDIGFNTNDTDGEIEYVNLISEYKNLNKQIVNVSKPKENMFPISFFIKNKKPKIMLKLEKMLSKGDYLGI